MHIQRERERETERERERGREERERGRERKNQEELDRAHQRNFKNSKLMRQTMLEYFW